MRGVDALNEERRGGEIKGAKERRKVRKWSIKEHSL